MKLAKIRLKTGAETVAIIDVGSVTPLALTNGTSSLSQILEADDPAALVASLTHEPQVSISEVELLAPIDQQEVWAAGVTYKRSKTARMEESEAAASCYDRVYESPRPELFLKATPHRVSGNGQPLRIRADATWNVPI